LQIRIYKIEIQIYKLQIRISKIEIRISKLQIRISKLEIRIFKLQIRIYGLEIRIFKSANSFFESEIRIFKSAPRISVLQFFVKSMDPGINNEYRFHFLINLKGYHLPRGSSPATFQRIFVFLRPIQFHGFNDANIDIVFSFHADMRPSVDEGAGRKPPDDGGGTYGRACGASGGTPRGACGESYVRCRGAADAFA
jgi:hypothetical protein